MATRKKIVNFEKAIEQLEDLVENMEEGDMTLEESLKAFENGIKLTQDCQLALTDAEQRVSKLVKDQQGELQSLPFEEGE